MVILLSFKAGGVVRGPGGVEASITPGDTVGLPQGGGWWLV